MKKGLDCDRIAESIYFLCRWLESHGNHGYRWELPAKDAWVTNRHYLEYRRGILFYSRGHGWRVRKHPYWQNVWNERFLERQQPLPSPEEVDRAFGLIP